MIVKTVVGTFYYYMVHSVAEPFFYINTVLRKYDIVRASVEEEPGRRHLIGLLDHRADDLAEVVHEGLR